MKKLKIRLLQTFTFLFTKNRYWKKPIQRRSMTLMEVLIASFLAMILLTAATSLYRQAVMIGKESEKLQEEQFKIAYLEKKLSFIFPRIVAPRTPSKDFYFFTNDGASTDKGLIFTYNHGIDRQSTHSGHLLAKIFIDQAQNLVLATWPSPKKWGEPANPTLTKEILLQDVLSLNFEFYVPPKKDRSFMVPQGNLDEIQPENSWHKSWKASYNGLPALIKILITKKKGDKEIPFTFIFWLPNSDFQIFYEN